MTPEISGNLPELLHTQTNLTKFQAPYHNTNQFDKVPEQYSGTNANQFGQYPELGPHYFRKFPELFRENSWTKLSKYPELGLNFLTPGPKIYTLRKIQGYWHEHSGRWPNSVGFIQYYICVTLKTVSDALEFFIECCIWLIIFCNWVVFWNIDDSCILTHDHADGDSADEWPGHLQTK